MFKIYVSPGSCSLASHIALAETGAPYEAVRVNFQAGEQRSRQYLAINPKGRVPALVTGNGILTETPAILVYLAQLYPQARLAPLDDPWALARLQSFNSYLCSTVHVHHAHRTRGSRWADDPAAIEALKRKVPQNVGEAFQLIEKEMLKGPWVMGEQYTVADPYLFTIALWLEGDSVDPEATPGVAEHRRRMRERPAVRKAMAEQGMT